MLTLLFTNECRKKALLTRCTAPVRRTLELNQQKTEHCCSALCFENLKLAMTYSPFKESTIGAKKLNFRVRNENGCTLLAKSPTSNFQTVTFAYPYITTFTHQIAQNFSVLPCATFPMRITSDQYTSAASITGLPPSAYQPDHLSGDLMIPNLQVGFPLRCFQRLSIPNIATQQCRWHDS